MTKEIVSDFSLAIKSKLALHPSIYVVCKAAKKAGIEYGEWFDADQPEEGLEAAIDRFLSKSPVPSYARKWIIEKCEDFGDNELDRYVDLHTQASFFAEYGRLGTALLNYFKHFDKDAMKEAREFLENHYYGVFPSSQYFIENHAAEKIDHLQENIDNIKRCGDECEIAYYEVEVSEVFEKDYFALVIDADESVHVFDKAPLLSKTLSSHYFCY